MIFYQPGFVCGNIMSRHQKKRNDNVNNFSLSHVVRPTSFRFSVFESVQFLFACFFYVVVFATFLDTHEAKNKEFIIHQVSIIILRLGLEDITNHNNRTLRFLERSYAPHRVPLNCGLDDFFQSENEFRLFQEV